MNPGLSKSDSNGRRAMEASPFALLRREMDDLVENFFGGRQLHPSLTQEVTPRLDLAETEQALEVTTDLPGYKPEELHIDVTDNCLTISGQRVVEQKSEEGNGKKYHRVERRSGSFSRSVWLPCAVDEDQIDAQLKDGVLVVKLPKAKAAQRKKITVKGTG